MPAGASDAGNAGEDVVNAGNTSIGSVSQQVSVSQVLLMMMVITAINCI